MIITDLQHADRQVPMLSGLRKAMDFLRLRGINELPDGTIEIDGKNVFAIVQRYETVKPDAPKFEYHRKYIDVQYIASGEEVIGWAAKERMTITEAYDADRDIAFGLVKKGNWTAALLDAGQLAILFPEDGHAPRLAAASISPVTKIVVKVAV